MSASGKSMAIGNTAPRGRVLAVASLAHVLHDGYASMLYLLLPFWQQELGLNLAEIGILKTLYSGGMAVGQVPAGLLSERRGETVPLLLGTLLTAGVMLALHQAATPLLLGLLLVLGGLGASVQHPLASTLVAKVYRGPALRTALGTYNFAGDLGKMALPALLTVLIASFGWRPGTEALGALGLAVTILLLLGLIQGGVRGTVEKAPSDPAPSSLPAPVRRRGFAALSTIGMIDSATRGGFLTFLPFVLAGKGAGTAAIGTALTLVFAGGAAGKFTCGALATRLGILRTVVLTEGGTAAAIALLLVLPLGAAFVLMPLLGIVLNGTSSVLYGTVPELAPADRAARAFGLFYTVTIGADALAPTLYGIAGDRLGLDGAMLLVAAVVLLILPLTLWLRPVLRRRAASA